MRISVINPNSSAAVTARIAASARAAARPGTEVLVRSVATAPAGIESHYDMVCAGPGLMQAVREDAATSHGFVLACFGDPGLNAARELTDRPIVGMAEAAFHAASCLGTGFVIVTTLPRMRIFAERLVEAAGMGARCRGIEVLDTGIADMADEASPARARLAEACRAALTRHHADCIVLGSAGMAGLGPELSSTIGVPVVDGVAVAVKWAEGLADLGLRTAKTGPLAAPPRL